MFLLSWLFISGIRNIDAPCTGGCAVFFSQPKKATVQLRSKLIPEEHVDEHANTYGNDLLSSRSVKTIRDISGL